MSRVLLVNPRICSPRSVRLPLSLLHLAAALEPEHPCDILDGNLDPKAVDHAVALLDQEPKMALGVTVMPGPQVPTAIELSRAVRERRPQVPIIWGGYFPTLYPDAAINAPYVDYVVRGQGEGTLRDLVDCLESAGPPPGSGSSATDPSAVRDLPGLTWKDQGEIRHSPDRSFQNPNDFVELSYERVGDVSRYLRPSFMGRRTGVHQAAIGCRFHCEFCGVVSMFDGTTHLQAPDRLLAAMTTLRDRWGADSMQFYDHNFFDTEEASREILQALVRAKMPWWCYARADTLANFAPSTWDLIRRSRLRMAYIGAEAASDSVLKAFRKGSRVEHTLEAASLCREYGVVPEFSFVLGGPEDPEGEMEKTFRFIQTLKGRHPECEVILYFYSPTPRRAAKGAAGSARLPVLNNYGPSGPELPATPEEWTQQRWIDYVCHQDAPWLTPAARRRVRDFSTVLGCRFPTVQDYHTPAWGKAALRTLARWRYRTGHYRNPWELRLGRRLLRPRQPQQESL